MKMTRHNGRAGKNGVYNPKHNDRQFDIGNSEHIDADRAKHNVYWDCFQGFRTGHDATQDSFADVEKNFYRVFYHGSVEAQNQRNIRNRHPERNKTTDDLLLDKRTCPEESILQIGKFVFNRVICVIMTACVPFFSTDVLASARLARYNTTW